MPCSAVTVDYRRDSTMPVPLSSRSIIDSDYNRMRYSNYSSSCVRRTSNTSSPFTDSALPKYSVTRSGLTASRSSSLTEDSLLRDKSLSRETTLPPRSTVRESNIRSRTTSSGHDSSKYSSLSYPRKSTNYTSYDLNEFRSTYTPGNYIVGTARAGLSKPPPAVKSSETSTRLRGTSTSSSLSKEKKNNESVESTTTVEVNSCVTTEEKLINGDNDGGGDDVHDKVEGKGDEGEVKRGDEESDFERMLDSLSPRHYKSSITSRKEAYSSSSTTSSTDNSAGLSGLRNIGNTCFLNSVVQCLSNTRLLKDFLISRDLSVDIRNSETKGALIRAFADVVCELWSGEGKVVNTSSFKAQIQRYAPRFMGYNQQDAQEFLRYLLEGIHDDINRVTVKPKNLPEIDDNLSDSVKATESWKQYLRIDNSRIVDLFVGQLKSTLQCTVCGHKSTTFEVFWDLSLPLPNRSATTLRLSQCLDHFTKEEVLDGDEMPTCSKCRTRRKCTKRFSIQKFPKILVLHLKRFSPSERYRKLSATIEFPLTNLDMSAFSSSQQTCTYNLYAVSNHSGTAHSGHYTAYCFHCNTQQWYEFNDSRVSQMSPRNVVSSEAYILFYEQSSSSRLSS